MLAESQDLLPALKRLISNSRLTRSSDGKEEPSEGVGKFSTQHSLVMWADSGSHFAMNTSCAYGSYTLLRRMRSSWFFARSHAKQV